MTRSGNRRRPRSGAPDQPDLREKAERMHSRIFGHNEQQELPPSRRGGWVRYAAIIALAAVAWALGEKLNNYYLLMFALAIAGSSIGIIIVRIIVACKRKK